MYNQILITSILLDEFKSLILKCISSALEDFKPQEPKIAENKELYPGIFQICKNIFAQK